nr:MAG TPA_asm: hypothetical protein [Caudoviricetes sp.]
MSRIVFISNVLRVNMQCVNVKYVLINVFSVFNLKSRYIFAL